MREKYRVLRSAEKMVANRKYAQAIREYEKLVIQEADDPNLINTLGDLLLRQGRRDEAISRFARVAQIFDDKGYDAKALATRRKIHQVNPVDSGNNEALIDLYRRQGLTSDAVSLLKDLVRRHEEWGQTAEALSYQRRISELDGASPENFRHLARLYLQHGDKETAVEHYMSAADIFRQEGLSLEFEECLQDVRRISPEDPRLTEMVNGTGQSEGTLDVDHPSDSQREYPEPEEEPQEFEEETTTDLTVEIRTEELQKAEMDLDLETAKEISSELRELEIFDEPGRPAISQEPWQGPIKDGLQEADFYLKLGHMEDAKRILIRLVDTFPEDDRVLRRAERARVPIPLLATGGGPSQSGGGREDELFEEELDFALNSLFTSGDSGEPAEVLRYDLTTVGKKEVRDEARVHYDLGLAYKEIGLLEDAIEKFENAFSLFDDSDNAPQMILCCSMLANAFLHLEKFRKAEEWAVRGLKLPELKEFEWKALQYDYALALENLGRKKKALDVYRNLLEEDRSYRDVLQRIEQLEDLDDQ